jgi:hypothetical protein
MKGAPHWAEKGACGSPLLVRSASPAQRHARSAFVLATFDSRLGGPVARDGLGRLSARAAGEAQMVNLRVGMRFVVSRLQHL